MKGTWPAGDSRVAVLVDADNIRPVLVRFAVMRAARHGRILIRRAFGRLASIAGRETELTDLGFSAEVALATSRNGKNAADIMLSQFAVSLAERRAVETVALVSSDSDFVVTARGLAERGIRVIGFGNADAPRVLQDSCTLFIAFPGTASAPSVAVPPDDMSRLISVIEGAMQLGPVRLTTLGAKLTAELGADYKDRLGAKMLTELLGRLPAYQIDGEGNARMLVRSGK